MGSQTPQTPMFPGLGTGWAGAHLEGRLPSPQDKGQSVWQRQVTGGPWRLHSTPLEATDYSHQTRHLPTLVFPAQDAGFGCWAGQRRRVGEECWGQDGGQVRSFSLRQGTGLE